MEVIISEQDIINTYNTRQQEQCKLFYEYKKLKKENSEFGYKRISKLLGQSESKTRWWNCGKHTPTPIQTVKWLKEKKLRPLSWDNPNLLLIAKILGATFSDGGIFENLNAIFLSSSEIESVKEFGNDLKKVFGEVVGQNSRIIEGGEYGHSWSYQNTNRNIIRLFKALGAPIGRKSKIKLKLPEWILKNEIIADNFIGSIIGGDGGIPKPIRNRPGYINIGITGKDNFKENRIDFLEELRKYFIMKGIGTNKIYISKGEERDIFKLPLKTTLPNFLNFYESVPINYCIYKKLKLKLTIEVWNEFNINERNQVISSD